MNFEEIMKFHARSYYFASIFLPRDIKEDIFALYAFVRFFDDIVDEENDLNKFLNYKEKFLSSLKIGFSDFDLFQSNLRIIKKYQIDQELYINFLKSMEMDFYKKNYQSWEKLNDYIYGSAEVIGIILSKIFGVSEEKAIYYAKKLGYAMQLTNFLRDFGEDYYKRGRIYFPSEELKKYKINKKTLDSKNVDSNLKEFVITQTKKIREIYSDCYKGFSFIKCFRCQLSVIVASNIYQNILTKIEKNNYDILNKRAFNNKLDFIFMTIKSLFYLFLK